MIEEVRNGGKLHRPENWQDFEKLARDYYAEIFDSRDVTLNGRQGQNQRAVDIHGGDRFHDNRLVGNRPLPWQDPWRRRTAAPVFALMTTAFAVQYLASASVLVHMVPLLAGPGLGATAALVGTLFGPSQVASRLINMLFGKRLDALRLAMISAALIPAGAPILELTAPSIPGAWFSPWCSAWATAC